MQLAMTPAVRRPFCWAVLVACVTTLAPTSADDSRPFHFSSIEVDGATFTEAWAINASGTIVGTFGTGAGTRGYVLDNGIFTTIEYPAPADGPAVIYTDARGINPAGDIVGMYRLAGEPNTVMHGYGRTRAGEFFTLKVPGRMGTVPTGILPDGTILGCSHDTNMTTTMYAFVRDASGIYSDYPMSGTMHFGATPDLSQIVGRLAEISPTGVQHFGYVLDDSGIHPFRVPGSIGTQAWGINPRGQVVGYSWTGGTATNRGFVKDDDTFTTIHHPDAVATWAFGINPAGDVVGTYYDGVKYRGYLASRTAQHNR